MASTQTIHINFKGGIVSPGYLKEVLLLAKEAGTESVRFGLRQQLIMELPASRMNAFATSCEAKHLHFKDKKYATPNIVSSYAAAGIFSGDTWLREGVYKDVFYLFNFTPKLKINICDSTQQLAPYFTGHINWIASPSLHFWYLYIRLPKTSVAFCWRELIYTNNMAVVSQEAERLITLGISNENELHKQLKQRLSYTARPIEKALPLRPFSLPYYEGFNKDNNTWWLGIYRREETFAVSFLKDVCDVCLQTKIGEVYTTPWKSLIVKGIEGHHRHLWDKVLGRYRINVRHAANELNWQVESEEGLMLKRLIIRHFDKEDVRTYGLCFAVQTKAMSSLFGSVIISKQTVKNPHRLRSLDRYNILYKEGFHPNSSKLVLFRENVAKDYLGTYLVSLCKFYYEQQAIAGGELQAIPGNGIAAPASPAILYQCKNCLTVYDEAAGDVGQNIAPGAAFNLLPLNYQCPTCDAAKDAFVAVNEQSLQGVF